MTPQALTLRQTQPAPMRVFWVFVTGLALLIAQTLTAGAQDRPATFADLADQVSTSVVNITTSTTVATNTGPAPQVPEGSPFEDFFRDFLDRNQGNGGPRPRRSQALGSGFVISEDGFIVTNNHVIAEADEILIEFFTGEEREATVIGRDPNTDLALLKVEADEPLDFVPWGASDDMRVGDWVMAMGNPLGQGFSVSAGIVSARGRALSGTYDDFIQTDAAINRGNSGGPLFNLNGEVLGVNTAIISPTGGSVGLGFSIPANLASQISGQIIEFGSARRGWFGVNVQDIDQDIAAAYGHDSDEGVIITRITDDSPASEADFEVGDLILTFDYENLNENLEKTAREFSKALKGVGLNARDGKTLDIVAHSMGGLVSRQMIERVRKGDRLVDRLLMFGTPNGGSAFGSIPQYRDLLTQLLSLALNFAKGWLGTIYPYLAGINQALIATSPLTITLDQMRTDSDFVTELYADNDPEVDPHTRYYTVAGDISDYKSLSDRRLARFMDKAKLKVGDWGYGEEPNDIAVSVAMIHHVPTLYAAERHDIVAHHMNYFEEGEGLEKLKELLLGLPAPE